MNKKTNVTYYLLSRHCSVYCASTVVSVQFNCFGTVICSLFAHWAKQQSSVIWRLSVCVHVSHERTPPPPTCTAEVTRERRKWCGGVFFAMQLIIMASTGLCWWLAANMTARWWNLYHTHWMTSAIGLKSRGTRESHSFKRCGRHSHLVSINTKISIQTFTDLHLCAMSEPPLIHVPISLKCWKCKLFNLW